MHDVHARLPSHLETLERNRQLLHRMLDGVPEGQADRALTPGGSTLRWLLAHLVAYRDVMIERAGGERVWDAASAAPYVRGSTPASAGPTLAALLALLDAQVRPLERAFAGLTPEALAGEGSRGSLGAELEFRVWHDTYHVGQAVLYRQAAGLPSPIG